MFKKNISVENNNFQVKEAYKKIRTNLIYTLASSDKNIIAISSSIPSEGKSTTVANIATSLAQINKKILLIDADMRKPVQHKLFRQVNTNGLSKVLSKQSEIDDAILKEVKTNLDILPSGPIPPNPSELLSSSNMKQFLEEVSKRYDFVLIDTAPINLVADCIAIVGCVAGIVLVTRQRHTKYSDVKRSLDSIQSVNGKVLGTIINDVKINLRTDSRYMYYKKAYGEYKSE